MNKRKKGRKFERHVAELFKKATWCIFLVQAAVGYNPVLKRFFAKPQDVFGADLIAMRDGRPFVFVQITSDKSVRRKVKTFQQYPFPWEISRCYIFQATFRDMRWKYRVFRVFQSYFEPVSEYELEDILGKVFWNYRQLFIIKGGKNEIH